MERTYALCLQFLMTSCVLLEVRGQTPLSFTIVEEQVEGSYVGNISKAAALDSVYDSDVLPLLRFSFLRQVTSYDDLFVLESEAGVLRTAKRIDRDVLCPHMESCVIPLDIQIQPPEYFRIVKLKVQILDINDNRPRFRDSQIVRSLSESSVVGTLLTIPTAEDPDSPQFGIQRYALMNPSDKFRLQDGSRQSGSEDIHLVLRESLDREQQDIFSVTVIAFDGGTPPKTGSINIEILVRDVNDNSPKFEKEGYEVTIDENRSIGSTVLTVKAWDPDEGPNGEVVYGFSERTEAAHGVKFVIDENTGDIIIVGELDFEEADTYALVVTAKDKHRNSVPTRTRVTIHVMDLNDHSPKIVIKTPRVNGHLVIPENSPNNSFVAHITVSDPDSGANGKFDCVIDDVTHFRLDRMYETEYKLLNIRALDREENVLYNVIVSCTDEGTTSQKSETRLVIEVTDRNDNAPRFTVPMYMTSIPEGNAIGDPIIEIRAVDPDANDNANVSYYLIGAMKDAFFMDSKSGLVTARAIFDRETMASLKVTVVATDQGAPPLTATTELVVRITDVDDEIPKFSRDLYTFSVAENHPGAVVGQVFAVDKDLAPYDQFSFSMAPNSAAINHMLFRVDRLTGQIRTRQALDREKKARYQFTILAITTSSKPATSHTSVQITVLDENDNDPVIDFPNAYNNTAFLDLSAAYPGYTFTSVFAHDDDIGQNANLSYFISSEKTAEIFSINSENGSIILLAELPGIESDVFSLIILVQDNGAPRRNTTAHFYIEAGFVQTETLSTAGTNNLIIVLAIVLTFSLVVAILLVLIAHVLRKRKRTERKYNWMAWVAGQHKLVTQTQKKPPIPALPPLVSILPASRTNTDDLKLAGIINTGLDVDEARITDTSSVVDISALANPAVDDTVDVASDAATTAGESDTTIAFPKWSSRHQDLSSPKAKRKLVYESAHRILKPTAFNPNLVQPRPSPNDRDSESGHSTSDSGRGSSVQEGARSPEIVRPPDEYLSHDVIYPILELGQDVSHVSSILRTGIPSPTNSDEGLNKSVRFHLPSDNSSSSGTLGSSYDGSIDCFRSKYI